MKKDCKTWVEIDSRALKNNIKELKKFLSPQTKMMAVVKSNAYGHGIVEVSKICVQSGIDWIGVDSVDEAIALREQGIGLPILILGYTILSALPKAVSNNIDLIVYNKETIKELGRVSSEQGREVNLHIKIETGTNRQGVSLENLLDFVNLIKQYPNLKIQGLSTHFANIEDTTDHSYAKKQLEEFKKAIKFLEENNIKIPVKHTACSAATILFPKTHFDLTRIGISLYGLWSSKETIVSAQQKNKKINLKPCLTWKTRIAQIKKIKAGAPISYGLTEKIAQDSKIAVLPIGYWDGLDRGLSSIGNVLIKGKRCKILGRICMNICMVDVSHISDIKLEDEVVLLGKQGEEEITAEDIANKLNTINYEVVTRINPLIPRFYI